jgi:opacity protein-like surface antigen
LNYHQLTSTFVTQKKYISKLFKENKKLKKINTLIVMLVMIFAVNSLKAQTYPVPKFVFHINAGYTFCLPDLKGNYPADIISAKDPTPYFIKNGYNFGADAKYFVDKKSTFGIMLDLTYSMLSSGDIAVADATYGTGTFRSDMNVFTLGLGAEYDFAPKRPANPFVNVMFTTNMFSGKTKFDATSGSRVSSSGEMAAAVRFGAMFSAGVDVKLSKSMGIVIGGKYAFANLFGKEYTQDSLSTSTYHLNDKEYTDGSSVSHKSKKLAYLQFYAGASFYFGAKKTIPYKK